MRWPGIMVVCLCLAMIACGCGTTSRSGSPALGLTPVEPRIDAIVGHALVIPVEIRGSVDPREPIRVTLSDGRAVRAELFWISVAPEPDRNVKWLSPAGRWSATPGTADVRPPGAGVWSLLVHLPSDAYRQSLSIGGTRVSLNWHPDPAGMTLAASPPALAPPRTRTLGEDLLAAIAEEARSPVRRWRHRLITGALWTHPGEQPDAFDDPVIEAFARQVEARWRAGLERLRHANPSLAAEIESRLTCFVEVHARSAPAWSEDQADLDSLRLDLLSPRQQSTERFVERANAWLATQPIATTWIMDDAAPTHDARGGYGVTLGAANVATRPVLASVFIESDTGPADLVSVPPRGVAELHGAVRSNVAMRHDAAAQMRVRARVDDEDFAHNALLPPRRAEPPGLMIAPLFHDATMHQWLNHEAPTGSSATAAMLHRGSFAGDASSSQGSWSLFVECRVDPSASIGAEHVRVWLGPRGAPHAVIRVGSDGAVVVESSRGELAAPTARVSREETRWTCQLDIPPLAIEPDAALLLAIERVDHRGLRSAWPRAMLPWQREPGRAAVDLSHWGELSAGRE